MNDQKLLTISIPTWNRSFLLLELLQQITDQVVKYQLENNIEIIVSDNFSTDETENIVSEFIKNHQFILYNKNSANLGAKTNVIKSLYLANSRYVLLLGDDDRIRHDCLPEIILFLTNNLNTSILIDDSIFKFKGACPSPIPLPDLLKKYYWYMGNAGVFITSTEFIKPLVDKYGYDFFNECWPQTQLMILGNIEWKGDIHVKTLNITTESKHDEVMIYSSFYLWRTCILELYHAANDLKNIIPANLFFSCREFMKSNMQQVFYNILQCGIFIDLPGERKKTRNHIRKNIHLFSSSEQIYLRIITIAFSLPVFISKSFSNIFILLTKGNSGLIKKNNYVKSELNKRIQSTQNKLSIRELEFEK